MTWNGSALKLDIMEILFILQSKQNLEVEMRLKTAALEDTNNKLVCAQVCTVFISITQKYTSHPK